VIVKITGQNEPEPFDNPDYNTEEEVEEYLFKLYWDNKETVKGTKPSMTHRWGKAKPDLKKRKEKKQGNYVNTYDYSMSRLIIVSKVPDESIPDVLVWLMKAGSRIGYIRIPS